MAGRQRNTRTAVSSEAWAKLRGWASVASRGRLLLSGSVAHASLKTAVHSVAKFMFSCPNSLHYLYDFLLNSSVINITFKSYQPL